ncbi:hypothetical protein XENOCAPTIV_024748 [Xenoophorus captivus]|uniref:Uncharacterized protein n=1 Tax=Xenoophorus captivus TaxID=1517983 RepID=A0ABV0QC54_9TELE
MVYYVILLQTVCKETFQGLLDILIGVWGICICLPYSIFHCLLWNIFGLARQHDCRTKALKNRWSLEPVCLQLVRHLTLPSLVGRASFPQAPLVYSVYSNKQEMSRGF